jgi:hypothetical protein
VRWLSDNSLKGNSVAVRIGIILLWIEQKDVVHCVRVSISNGRLIDTLDADRPYGASVMRVTQGVRETVRPNVATVRLISNSARRINSHPTVLRLLLNTIDVYGITVWIGVIRPDYKIGGGSMHGI